MPEDNDLYLEGKVEDVMTRNPVCVQRTDNLRTLVGLFRTHKFHGFPVVDERGKLVGIVRDTDLVSIFARRDPASRVYRKVEDIMCTPPSTIGLKDTIQDAIMKTFADQTRLLVVIDETKRIAGIVTRIDLIRGIRFGEPREEDKPAGE